MVNLNQNTMVNKIAAKKRALKDMKQPYNQKDPLVVSKKVLVKGNVVVKGKVIIGDSPSGNYNINFSTGNKFLTSPVGFQIGESHKNTWVDTKKFRPYIYCQLFMRDMGGFVHGLIETKLKRDYLDKKKDKSDLTFTPSSGTLTIATTGGSKRKRDGGVLYATGQLQCANYVFNGRSGQCGITAHGSGQAHMDCGWNGNWSHHSKRWGGKNTWMSWLD